MAKLDDKLGDAADDFPTDEVTQLKKRARREYGKSAKKAVRLARHFFRQGEKSRLSGTFA